MELSILTRAMREVPVKRDFFGEALSRIDRVLATENFSDEEPDSETLLGQFNTALDETQKINALEERVAYLRENIDTMTDKEIISHLNVIEPVFSNNEVTLATEELSTRIRGKAILACEEIDKRIKFALIALIITALLKAIAWLISLLTAGAKINGKRSKKRPSSGLDKDQIKVEEEIRELAKDHASEVVARKYAVATNVVREQMMRLYQYPSDGNLRKPGGRGAGAAAEVASLMIDKINALTDNPEVKEKYRNEAIDCVTNLIECGVPLGHFAFCEKSRAIVAEDIVNFVARGRKGPISKTMSLMATLLPDDITTTRKLVMTEEYLSGEVRFLTAGTGEDLLSYLDNLEESSSNLDRFFREFGGINDYDILNPINARETSLTLNSLIVFKDKDQYDSLVSHVLSNLRESSFIPTTVNPVSTPMMIDTKQAYNSLMDAKQVNIDVPPSEGAKFVSPSAYSEPCRRLDDLSGDDAIYAFGRWFYEHHGEYDRNDTIKDRLEELTFLYANNRELAKAQLKKATRNFERLHELSKEASASRGKNILPDVGSNGFATYIYDIEVPYFTLETELPNGRRGDIQLTTPLGKRVENICKTLRDSIAGWGGIVKTIERYDRLASRLY